MDPDDSRPGENRDKGDADDDGRLDSEGHQECSEKAATNDSQPHLVQKVSKAPNCRTDGVIALYLRVRHDNARWAFAVLVQSLGRASADCHWGRDSTRDNAYAGCIRHADEGKKQADAHAAGGLDGTGDDLDQPVAHAREGQQDKDPALDEDCS